jgi:hypothetical protein
MVTVLNLGYDYREIAKKHWANTKKFAIMG